jgi:hypothetical protein
VFYAHGSLDEHQFLLGSCVSMYGVIIDAAQAVRELTGLVEGANALLSGSKGLETKYLSLPSYASQRLSLALEADPNAVSLRLLSLPQEAALHVQPIVAARLAADLQSGTG